MKKIFLLLFMMIFCSVVFAEGNYQFIGFSSNETLSFDTDTIKFTIESGAMLIEVWVKHQMTLDGAKEYIQERQKNKQTFIISFVVGIFVAVEDSCLMQRIE